jgi:protein TonB
MSDFSAGCAIASESPAGMGFGRAALSIAGSLRADPQLSNGAAAAGARARVTIEFRPP